MYLFIVRFAFRKSFVTEDGVVKAAFGETSQLRLRPFLEIPHQHVVIMLSLRQQPIAERGPVIYLRNVQKRTAQV